MGAAGVSTGGVFKPARYTGAVSGRYATFLFLHQGGGIVCQYDIVDIVARYSVPARTCHLTKKIFVISCITSRQTLKDRIYLLLFTVTKISLTCVAAVTLHFPVANTFVAGRKRETNGSMKSVPSQNLSFFLSSLLSCSPVLCNVRIA